MGGGGAGLGGAREGEGAEVDELDLLSSLVPHNRQKRPFGGFSLPSNKKEISFERKHEVKRIQKKKRNKIDLNIII